jgi:outer membrane protein TolC
MLNPLQYSEIKKVIMNKSIILTTYLLLTNAGLLVSQQAALKGSLTFDQAIATAIQNNPELKIKDFDILIAAEQYNEARLRMVPQIYGRYDIQRNLIIPSTLVPLGRFNPELPPDELTPIKFGTNWLSIAGLFASVKIFDPQVTGDMREKKASVKLSDIERKITRIDLETETGKAYANCLLSLEQLRFAVDDTLNSYKQLTESYMKFNSGILKQTDLNLAVLKHSSSISRFNEAGKILSDSYKTLFYWMGITEDANNSVALSDSLDVLINRLSSYENENRDIESSLTYLKLNAINNIDNIKLRNVKTGFLPVISLNGLLSTDYYNNQLRLGNSAYWFGNSNINLSLHVPITEGIDRTRRIKQQKYQIEANREELNAALNKKQLDIKRVSDNIEFYRKETISKKSDLELAAINYKASFSLFREGRILPSGLSDAEISYKQVKIDYLKVLFNYLDSLLELKRIIQS